MKRTFVVPEEKEQVYEKFKSLVPEVSAKLVQLMEEYVQMQEAVQEDMELQTTYDGVNDLSKNVYSGKTFKFKGVLIAEDAQEDSFKKVTAKAYLTLKGKLLVSYSEADHFNKEKLYHRVFDNYDDLVNNGKLTREALVECSNYLCINSIHRPFEMLDV